MVFRLPEAEPSSATSEDEFSDARAPDDDALWRMPALPDMGNPEVRRATLISQCEEKLQRALQSGLPHKLLSSIKENGCTALQSKECARCRICPSEDRWARVYGYYKGQKAQIFICADKEPSQSQVEQTLTHELIHAYDHCRYGMRIPFAGRHQAPWALTCAATACSEVCIPGACAAQSHITRSAPHQYHPII
jgi:hypothetical protein